MSKEYIERELLIKQFSGGDEMKSMSESIHDSRFVEELKKIPAADVEPIVQGEWLDHHGDFECSVCKTVYSDEIRFMNKNYEGNPLPRCPECGAHMKNGGCE